MTSKVQDPARWAGRAQVGLALTLAAAAGLLASGCSRHEPPPQAARGPVVDTAFVEGSWSPALLEGVPRQGGTLTVRLPNEPSTLNRLIASETWLERMVRPGVTETLLRIDGEDQPAYPLRPCLAETYEESSDHLVYTFHLRHGVVFHDGQPFTARDVVVTFDKLMDPKLHAQPLRSLLEGLTSWKALDDFTVRFTFKAPNYLALRQLATSIPIYPSGVLAHLSAEELNGPAPINRAPIGTGPWRFEKWEPGQAITFVRNDAYWDPARTPHLDRLVWKVVPDSEEAYQLMARGELDVNSGIPAEHWVSMPQDAEVVKRFRRLRYFNNNYGFVGWNERRPFFTDKRVRLAMAELFDQDDFNDVVQHGLELRTECVFYEPSGSCDPDLKPIAHDPAHARQLLEQAGWVDHDGDGIRDKGGVPFRFHLMVARTNARFLAMAEVLRETYAKEGIALVVDRVDWAPLFKRLNERDFDAIVAIWGVVDREGDPYELWHSSQIKSGSNWVAFSDPVVDRLIEQGRREFDPKRREAIWRELGRELHEQQPFMMLTVRPELEAVSRRFRGVMPSLAYYDFAKWWAVE